MNIEAQITTIESQARAMASIHTERTAHTTREEWSAEHDDGHVKGELWRAALFYANTAIKTPIWAFTRFHVEWPWEPQWFKPWKKNGFGNYTTEIDQERCLIKAGALIIAEQERLDRALHKVVAKLAEIQNQNTK